MRNCIYLIMGKSKIEIQNIQDSTTKINAIIDSVFENKDNIEELRQNTKWLYKYGGTGSGTGGGSGNGNTNSRTFQLVYIGDESLVKVTNGEKFTTDINIEKGPKKFEFYPINQDPTCTYKYTYQHGTSPKSKGLVPDTDGIYSFMLDINGNSSIIITALNVSTQENTILELKYVTDPVVIKQDIISINMADRLENVTLNSGNNFSSDLFMGSYKSIKVKLSYIFYKPGTITWGCSYENAKFLEFSVNTNDGKTEIGKEFIEEFELIDNDILKDPMNVGVRAYEFDTKYINETNIVTTIPINAIKLSLIPSELFALVIPDSGKLYTSSQIQDDTILDNTFIYLEGARTFTVKIYNGSDTDSTYSNVSIVLKKGDTIINSVSLGAVYVRSNIIKSIYIAEKDEDGKEITLDIISDSFDKTFTYYLYVKNNPLSIKWFNNNVPNISYYFNKADTEDKSNIFQNYTANGQIMANTGETVSCSFKDIRDYPLKNDQEFLLSIGYQLNYVRAENAHLFQLTNSFDSKYQLDIYQHLIEYSAQQINNIYIPYEQDFDKDDNSKYHLIQIYQRAVSEKLYEVVFYLDGVIDGVLSNYTNSKPIFDTITINPTISKSVNISCNYIGYHIFDYEKTFQWEKNYAGMTDYDIVSYYYRYLQQKDQNFNAEEYMNILNAYKDINPIYGGDGKSDNIRSPYVKLTSNNLQTIAKFTKMDIVKLEFMQTPDIGFTSFDDFMALAERSYQQNEDPEVCYFEDMLYKPANAEAFISPTYDKIGEDSIQDKCKFSIKVQGSSTKGYRAKNYEIGVCQRESDSGFIPIYSLNYDPNDPDTFYPEQSFTFKGDITDSSHCNNTGCGLFVNTVTTPFNIGYKNCLEGIPVLLCVSAVIDNEEIIYLLGIYNYNLGRESWYNLYGKDKPSSVLEGFAVTSISSDAFKTNFAVTEVRDNDPYFDFSQYDDSILFEDFFYTDSTCTTVRKGASGVFYDDSLSMLDHSQVHTTMEDKFRRSIKTAIQEVALAGGAIYKEIGKNFTDDMYRPNSKNPPAIRQYTKKNYVPNYKKQYKRYYIRDGESNYSFGYTATDIQPQVLRTALSDCIYQAEIPGREGQYKQPSINYTSLLQYYTICMALGLMDSIMKNMNLKTWTLDADRPTWNISFYDMDTALGLDNKGGLISPFAFTDYWEVDTENKNIVIKNRDYWPQDSQYTGYDIACNYIFAIPKYAPYIVLQNTGMGLDPLQTVRNYWLQLRSLRSAAGKNDKVTGQLQNAKYFLDNFFFKRMQSTNEIIWNLNYRYKYLNQDQSGFSPSTLVFFHGRRYYYTLNWMNKRLHLLDAYFNVNQSVDNLNGIKIYNEEDATLEAHVKDNPDVTICRQMFASDPKDQTKIGTETIQIGTTRTYRLNFYTTDFAPIVVKNNTTLTYYLGMEGIYQETEAYSNNQPYGLYGSSNITQISDCSDMSIDRSFYLNNDYIQTVEMKKIASTQTSGFTFYTPALEHLTITWGDAKLRHKGELKIYKNSIIKSIDITGTSITIPADTSGKNEFNNFINLESLNLSNTEGANISLLNATKLSVLKLDNAKLSSIVINPINGNINFSGTSIQHAEFYTTEKKTFSMSNDMTIETLKLSGFSSITLDNNQKLREIEILNPGELVSLTINRCGLQTASKLIIKTSDHPAETKFILGKEFTSLTNINLNGTNFRGDVKISAPNVTTISARPYNLNLQNTSFITIGTLDVSECYNLTSINLNNNLNAGPSVNASNMATNINKLILPVKNANNSEKYIDISSPIFCGTALTSIEGNLNIQAANSVYEYSRGLTTPVNKGNLKFSNTITSLSRMFYYTSLNIDGMKKVANALAAADIQDKLTDISWAFKDTSATVDSFINNNGRTFKEVYPNLTNISMAFHNCGGLQTQRTLTHNTSVNPLNMFGSNSNAQYRGNVTIEYDALVPIQYKGTALSDTLQYINLTIHTTKSNQPIGNSPSNAIKVYNIFKDSTITTLNFNITNSGIFLDFSNVDGKPAIPTTVTNIDGFLNNSNTIIYALHINDANPDGPTDLSKTAFGQLAKLTSAYGALSSLRLLQYDEDGNIKTYVRDNTNNIKWYVLDKLDLYNNFNWANLLNTKSTDFFSIGVMKKIMGEQFLDLIKKLFSSQKITKSGPIFKYTTVSVEDEKFSSNEAYWQISSTNEHILNINIPENEKITNISELFSLCHLYLSRTLLNNDPAPNSSSLYTRTPEKVWMNFISIDSENNKTIGISNLKNCINYNSTWFDTFVYKLSDDWFGKRTPANISDLGSAFAYTNFLQKWSDTLQPYGDECYYIDPAKNGIITTQTVNHLSESTSVASGTFNRVPSDGFYVQYTRESRFRGYYIIPPYLFYYIENDQQKSRIIPTCKLTSMFSCSNLEGLLPKDGIFTNDIYTDRAGMFSDTLIIPYKVNTIYQLYKKNSSVNYETNGIIKYNNMLTKIHIWCMVPDGVTESQTIINPTTGEEETKLVQTRPYLKGNMGNTLLGSLVLPQLYNSQELYVGNNIIKELFELGDANDSIIRINDPSSYSEETPEDINNKIVNNINEIESSITSIPSNGSEVDKIENNSILSEIDFIYQYNQYSIDKTVTGNAITFVGTINNKVPYTSYNYDIYKNYSTYLYYNRPYCYIPTLTNYGMPQYNNIHTLFANKNFNALYNEIKYPEKINAKDLHFGVQYNGGYNVLTDDQYNTDGFTIGEKSMATIKDLLGNLSSKYLFGPILHKDIIIKSTTVGVKDEALISYDTWSPRNTNSMTATSSGSSSGTTSTVYCYPLSRNLILPETTMALKNFLNGSTYSENRNNITYTTRYFIVINATKVRNNSAVYYKGTYLSPSANGFM